MSFLGLFSSAAGAAAEDAFTPEPPWKAKTVVATGMATLAGTAGWISDIVSPAVARFGGSYIAGFFIGWAFRRFVMGLEEPAPALTTTRWNRFDERQKLSYVVTIGAGQDDGQGNALSFGDQVVLGAVACAVGRIGSCF